VNFTDGAHASEQHGRIQKCIDQFLFAQPMESERSDHQGDKQNRSGNYTVPYESGSKLPPGEQGLAVMFVHRVTARR